MDQILRKATDTDLHPNNMHTDDGFFLKSWRPFIYTQKECKKVLSSLEQAFLLPYDFKGPFVSTLYRASYSFIITPSFPLSWTSCPFQSLWFPLAHRGTYLLSATPVLQTHFPPTSTF
jgi:hypothetical protein